jgi:hypothetical protein
MIILNPLHARFLLLLPRIEAHANFYFRFVRCPADRADHIAETIALAWQWFVQLDQRGKDAAEFVTTLATFAARAVRCGRRVAGMPKAKDVMNRQTQQRHDYVVERLPDHSSHDGNPLTEALADNMVTPPPDAAAFRVDFPRWLGSLRSRDRQLASELMVGERTGAAARRFGMTEARVSQVRRELCDDWSRFHGEAVVAAA